MSTDTMRHRAPRFVVYHIASTMKDQTYFYENHAKARVEKLNAHQTAPQFAYATVEHYNTKVVHMVERTHLKTGEKYMELSNTPDCCSPASETFWSM